MVWNVCYRLMRWLYVFVWMSSRLTFWNGGRERGWEAYIVWGEEEDGQCFRLTFELEIFEDSVKIWWWVGERRLSFRGWVTDGCWKLTLLSQWLAEDCKRSVRREEYQVRSDCCVLDEHTWLIEINLCWCLVRSSIDEYLMALFIARVEGDLT